MDNVDEKKRKVLIGVTTATLGVGAGFMFVPYLASMSPSERAKAAGAPVEVDVSKIASGSRVSVTWRGKPVWIVRRSKEVLANINSLNETVDDPLSDNSLQPDYCKNDTRSIKGKEEFFVAISLCTHLGCIPSYRPEVGPQDFSKDWKGGFYCPCHGSLFDLAGRVYPGVPAPTNLQIPPYYFASDTKLVIGIDNDSQGAT